MTPEDLTAFRKTFLPIGPVPPSKTKGPTVPQRGTSTQNVHPLNQYAFNLVHLIEKEYSAQISKWKTAFSEVVTCLAGAITQKNDILKAAEAERQADAAAAAAFNTLLLSFLMVGAMSFLGAYVEHTLIPSLVRLKRVNDPLIMGLNTQSPFIVKSTKLVTVHQPIV